jgi:hypothetical protein
VSAFFAESRVRRVFLGIAALIGWVSLALQLDRNIRDAYTSGQTLLHGVAHFATFFTTTTNVFAAGVLTLALVGGKCEPKPATKAAVASYMLLVFTIFALLLDGNKHRTGIDWLANTGVHYVMPLLMLVNWLAGTPHGSLNWRQPFTWIAYPAVYFVYMLLRGLFAGDFPYWFLNPARVGWPHLFVYAALLLIVFWAVGQIFVWVDGILARFFQPVDASGHPA